MNDPFDYFNEMARDFYSQIDDDTLLLDDSNGHIEDIIDIIEYMIGAYTIADPTIPDWNVYFRHLITRRGFVLRDISRYFSRVPELDFSRITVGELCRASRSGKWPPEVEKKLLQGLPTHAGETTRE